MRKIALILVIAALGWSGYWLAGSIALTRAVTGWFEARSAEGWLANLGDVSVSGFPGRFDMRLTRPELADPDTGIAWSAPAFDFTARSASPTRITATWPGIQTLASPFERIEIVSDRMEGTVGFAPNTALALRNSDIALENVRLTSTAGWAGHLASGRLVTMRAERGANAHEILFDASDLTLPRAIRSLLDPTDALPEAVGRMRLDAYADFDAPWDRRALEDRRPQITALELDDLRATWGELELRAAGQLVVDGAGVPTGEITVKATNWREMLAIAEATGAVPTELVPTAERALEFLARLSGPENTLDAPLSFRRGNVSLGPIPLGRAPRLTIR